MWPQLPQALGPPSFSSVGWGHVHVPCPGPRARGWGRRDGVFPSRACVSGRGRPAPPHTHAVPAPESISAPGFVISLPSLSICAVLSGSLSARPGGAELWPRSDPGPIGCRAVGHGRAPSLLLRAWCFREAEPVRRATRPTRPAVGQDSSTASLKAQGGRRGIRARKCFGAVAVDAAAHAGPGPV